MSKKGSSVIINVRELIWNLLEQWKAIVIVALIFGIICTGFMYHREVGIYNAELAKKTEMANALDGFVPEENGGYFDEYTEQVIESNIESLSEEDQLAVRNLIQMHNSLNASKEYCSQSILMNIDPVNKKTLKILYGISVSNEDQALLPALASSYQEYIKDDLEQFFAEALGQEVELKYLDELIKVLAVSNLSTPSSEAVLQIEYTIPDNVDINMIQESTDGIMQSANQVLSGSIGNHKVSKIYSKESIGADYDLLNKQADLTNKVIALTNNIKSLEGGLTEAPKSAYSNIKTILYADSEVPQEAIDNGVSVNVKWFAAGFVIGILVYAIVYIIYIVLFRKIRTKEEVEDTWFVRTLGEIYAYNKKGLKRAIFSKNIFRAHHHGKTNQEKQIGQFCDLIESLNTRMELEEITLVPLVKEDAAGHNTVLNDIFDRIESALSGQGISVQKASVFAQSGDLQEKQFLDLKNVIPVIVSDQSQPYMAGEVIRCAKFYNTSILGSMFIGQ